LALETYTKRFDSDSQSGNEMTSTLASLNDFGRKHLTALC